MINSKIELLRSIKIKSTFSTRKLEKTKASFEKTHELVLHQIDRDVENMHKYL